MSEASYFICAEIKQPKNDGTFSTEIRDLRIDGPWAIRSDYEYEEFRQAVSEKLRVCLDNMTIINMTVLYKSF